EATREQDPIFLIQDPDRVKAEGFAEVQDARKLSVGMPAVVEPMQPEGPGGGLRGHREQVNAVAVSKGSRPVIVSASDDRTPPVWAAERGRPNETGRPTWAGAELWKLEHPSPVKSVACTPPGAARNLCLTGTADGVGRLWNLDDLRAGPTELSETHKG